MMKKIKIAHLITKLELGGAQEGVLYLVEKLPRHKYEVLLICGVGGMLDEEAKRIPRTRVIFVPTLIRSLHPLKDFLTLISLVKIFLKERPDIVHTNSSKAGILGRWAAFFVRIPVIMHTFHGFGFNRQQKFFVRILFIFLEQITALISTKLVAVSWENVKKGLNYLIGTKRKYTVIRCGIKFQKFQEAKRKIHPQKKKEELGLLAEDKIVGIVACFKPQKAPLNAVGIAKKVVEEFPQAKFLFVGDGELRPQIEKRIKELDLENNVFLLGWRRDIEELYPIFNCLLLASLWEGLPRVILEAMICEVPVVVSRVDGNQEIVKDGENGFLVSPQDQERFACCLLKILKDDKLAQLLGKKGKETVDKFFHIDTMVSQLDQLYGDLYFSKKKEKRGEANNCGENI